MVAKSFEDLQQLQHHELVEELAVMKRAQLQSLAKKCGIKANQRTLELTGAIVEHVMKQRKKLGGASSSNPRLMETHVDTTPYNPVFNPRYAPTDTKKAAASLPQTSEQQQQQQQPSTTRGTWLVNKSKELSELEAALKSIMPPPKARLRASTTAAVAGSLNARVPITGTKRKERDNLAAVTSAERHPLVKRMSSIPTSMMNTLALKDIIIRRPGVPHRNTTTKPAVPSRLGRKPQQQDEEDKEKEQVQPAAPLPEFTMGTPSCGAPTTTTVRRIRTGNSSGMRPVSRANRAQDAYVKRMRSARNTPIV